MLSSAAARMIRTAISARFAASTVRNGGDIAHGSDAVSVLSTMPHGTSSTGASVAARRQPRPSPRTADRANVACDVNAAAPYRAT